MLDYTARLDCGVGSARPCVVKSDVKDGLRGQIDVQVQDKCYTYEINVQEGFFLCSLSFTRFFLSLLFLGFPHISSLFLFQVFFMMACSKLTGCVQRLENPSFPTDLKKENEKQAQKNILSTLGQNKTGTFLLYCFLYELLFILGKMKLTLKYGELCN